MKISKNTKKNLNPKKPKTQPPLHCSFFSGQTAPQSTRIIFFLPSAPHLSNPRRRPLLCQKGKLEQPFHFPPSPGVDLSPKPPFTKGFFPRLKTRATDPVSQTEPSPSSPSTSLLEAADRPANRPSAGHPPVIFLCELRAAACRREEQNQQDAQQRRLRRPRQKQADASQLLHQPPPNYLK